MRKDELGDKDHALLFGPYTAPACKVGDWLDDAYYGRVEVGGFTDALVGWPKRRRKGPPAPILTGTLLDAIRTESVYAVAYWWGVSRSQVQNWRRWLEVDRTTPGSARLLAANAKAIPAAVREAVAVRRRGQQQPAHVRAVLLEHAKKPKPAEWRARAGRWMADGRRSARGIAVAPGLDDDE